MNRISAPCGNVSTIGNLPSPNAPSRERHTAEEFDAALAAYLAGATKLREEWLARMYTRTKPPVILFSTMPGPKYLRVVVEEDGGNQRSVYSFVERATGDVYKPEGWKKPAKHVRSNIFSAEHGLENHNWHGPEYLR